MRSPSEDIAASTASDDSHADVDVNRFAVIEALVAAEEISAESEHHSLGMSLRALLGEGRRG